MSQLNPTGYHLMIAAGRYGLPLQPSASLFSKQRMPKQERMIKQVKKISASTPPRRPYVPREEWEQYAQLRQQIRALQSSYAERKAGQPK